jgi:hypothetical protein
MEVGNSFIFKITPTFRQRYSAEGARNDVRDSPVEMQRKGIRFAGGYKFNNARELSHVSQCPITIPNEQYSHP